MNTKIEQSLLMPDGRRFIIRPHAGRWEIEYLYENAEGAWVTTATKPVYDEAVWVTWQIATGTAPPQEQHGD